MRSLKNHFSVIIPLLIVLLCVEFIFILDRMIKDYENNLIEDYSIVLISSSQQDLKDLQERIKEIKSMQLIDPKGVLDKLKEDMSQKNLELLKIALPKFYSIKLNNFPNNETLKSVKNKLLKIENISKVETFSKTHEKIYKIFTIFQSVAYVFAIFLLIIAFLLMLKQMRIWLYEHKERIDIMALFGANFWMKSISLYKLAFFDAIISSLLSMCFIAYFINSKEIKNLTSQMQIAMPNIDILHDSLSLLGISLSFAILSVSIVMFQSRKSES